LRGRKTGKSWSLQIRQQAEKGKEEKFARGFAFMEKQRL
jgi:hypothetical protein